MRRQTRTLFLIDTELFIYFLQPQQFSYLVFVTPKADYVDQFLRSLQLGFENVCFQ